MEQNDKSFVGLAKPKKSKVVGSRRKQTIKLQARDGAAW